MAKHLVNHYRPQVAMSDVVVLSPYREQRSKITELLKGAYEKIQVTTIIKSQGKAVISSVIKTKTLLGVQNSYYSLRQARAD